MSGFGTIVVTLSILVAFGVAVAVRTYRFVRRGRKVRAKVVSVVDASVHNPETASQSGSIDRWSVELPASGNRKRIVPLADAFGGSFAEKLVGQDGTVAVIYDPKRPNIVRIDNLVCLYFIPAFLCAPAILFLLFVAYVTVVS